MAGTLAGEAAPSSQSPIHSHENAVYGRRTRLPATNSPDIAALVTEEIRS
jgi:hypothetical protein